jgi:hypothetical protein
MKNLLFFTAAALLLVESTVAYASPPSENILERTDKWSGSAQREVWGPPVPPAAYSRGYAYSPGYSYSHGYSPNAYGYVEQGRGDVGYCMRRFRSYDPRSGTYLGFDGLRHPCP